MNNYQEKYRESLYMTMLRHFHEVTENDWHEEPTIPSKERLQLRANLIVEEAREFEQAAKDENLTEMADALVDLLYVTMGSVGELGLSKIFADLFEEVHRSNMSKICKTEAEALETIRAYEEGINGLDKCVAKYRPCKTCGGFIVYRESDNKTLKSINYSPADIVGILETHSIR